MPPNRSRRRFALGAATCAWACSMLLVPAGVLAQGISQPAEPLAVQSVWEQLWTAAVRLPLAAVFGTTLALRPRRRGTPARSMPVIETQIILSIVGALIMLVVGASLARAFGIVGAANLIRYRAKIDDPKDAVVMLSALAVGLACGVGLYVIAALGTLFVGTALWVIEGFEPEEKKNFELTVRVDKGAPQLRTQIEAVLRRSRADFELRTSAEDTVSYLVKAPARMSVERVSEALTALKPDGVTVEWDDKKPKKTS